MWEAPIKTIERTLLQKKAEVVEKEVMTTICQLGIQVDKEELLKALEYDRDQYHKGYHDGKMDAVVHAHWIKENDLFFVCSNCGTTCPYNFESNFITHWECKYCPICGAQMDGDVDG